MLNIRENAQLETGGSAWQSENTQIYNWGHNGSSCSTGGWWAFSGWQHVDGIDPNAIYTVGGYLYDDVIGGETMTGGIYANLEAQFKNASDVVVGTWSSGNITGADMTDDAWNAFVAQVKPSNYGLGITKMTFKWEMNNNGGGSGRGIFDDLMVEQQPIPEPASLILLGVGLVGLFGINKMRK